MKQKKTVLILLLALLALAGAAIWLLGGTGDPQDDEDLYAVRHTREEFQSLTLTNEAGGLSFRADPESPTGYACAGTQGLPEMKSRFVSLVDDTVTLKATARYPDSDYARYGLDDPRETAEVTLKDGSSYTVLVGDDAPGDGLRYFAVSTDPGAVYVTRKAQFLYYKETDLYFVDRLLAPRTDSSSPYNNETDLPDALSVTVPSGETISLTRWQKAYEDGAGQLYRYHQSSPVEGEVTAERMQASFDRVMQFCAASVQETGAGEDRLAAYGLDRPDTVLTLEWKDSRSVIRLKAAPDGNWYAYREGVDAVWKVADYLVTWMDLEGRDLLSPWLLAPRMEDTERVDLVCYGRSYSFPCEEGDLFAKFYRLCCGVNSVNPGSAAGEEKVRITFRLTDGSVRTLSLYDCGNRDLEIALDGERMGLLIRENYAETLAQAAEAYAQGQDFSDIW